MFFAHSLDYYVHYTQKSPIIQSPYLPDFDSVFWWFFPPFFASTRKKIYLVKWNDFLKNNHRTMFDKRRKLTRLEKPQFFFLFAKHQMQIWRADLYNKQDDKSKKK